MDNNIFEKNVALLSHISEQEEQILPTSDASLPSVDTLHQIVETVKLLVFPGFFDMRQIDTNIRSYHIGLNMERLVAMLSQQIALALLFESEEDEEKAQADAREKTLMFIDRLPEIKRMLYTDAQAIFNEDPSVRTESEVIFCFPAVAAILHYRVAHELLRMGIPVIPRIITELAHAKTGIDIHPCARIGEYFSIHHGTGVVIGETCVIGNHVTLYQGVTLGARNYRLSNLTHPHGVPRHPILEDHVTIYSNSTILGRVTIGHDTVIGGNIWIANDVPPHSKILQSKHIDATFIGGLGI